MVYYPARHRTRRTPPRTVTPSSHADCRPPSFTSTTNKANAKLKSKNGLRYILSSVPFLSSPLLFSLPLLEASAVPLYLRHYISNLLHKSSTLCRLSKKNALCRLFPPAYCRLALPSNTCSSLALSTVRYSYCSSTCTASLGGSS
jgi:hypothetical protein